MRKVTDTGFNSYHCSRYDESGLISKDPHVSWESETGFVHYASVGERHLASLKHWIKFSSTKRQNAAETVSRTFHLSPGSEDHDDDCGCNSFNHNLPHNQKKNMARPWELPFSYETQQIWGFVKPPDIIANSSLFITLQLLGPLSSPSVQSQDTRLWASRHWSRTALEGLKRERKEEWALHS